MQVLVVDDEPLLCSTLASALERRMDIDRVDVAADAKDALHKLQTTPYDVLLLDIDMPKPSGMELLERLPESSRCIPSVILVTASPEHAVSPFQKQAVDCLLKPFSEGRLGKALDRASRVNAGQRAAKFVHEGPQWTTPCRPRPGKIGIKEKRGFLFVDPTEVVTVHAKGNYVLLKKENGSCLLRQAISDIADVLEHFDFIRIHRSVLVNKSFVEEIVPYTKGEYGLRMKGGKEYSVTRTYKRNLRSLAAFWFGTKIFVGE